MNRRGRLLAIGAGAGLIALTVARPAAAGDHFADQRTVKISYTGGFGYFQTRNPYVPDVYNQFSLCHLYFDNKLVGQLDYRMVEFGYYKGFGTERVVGDPRLYAAYWNIGGYREYNSHIGPGSGAPFYLLENVGYISSNGLTVGKRTSIVSTPRSTPLTFPSTGREQLTAGSPAAEWVYRSIAGPLATRSSNGKVPGMIGTLIS